MIPLLRRSLCRKPPLVVFSSSAYSTDTLFSFSSSTPNLRSKYFLTSPTPSNKNDIFRPESESKTRKQPKTPYRPPSSLERSKPPVKSDLPFDFRFSYTESSPKVRPIGLRGPKYSPFGPERLDRVWTGVCAPAIDPKAWATGIDEDLAEKRRRMWEQVQGEPLTETERKALVANFQRPKTKRQINLGRDGLTHNMLNDIHNHWKSFEAVRIKCLGVSTVDMKNVCAQLEEKAFGKIIHRHGGLLVLYRGRHYNPRERPAIPLMLWKPQEPVYPKLIKTTIEGLSIEETKELRKKGLSVPPLTRLAKNGYYGSLICMIRDAFLCDELIRIDCRSLPKSDYKKIGCKLRDLVPCTLVTFEKEQIVVWRGKNYKPMEGENFFSVVETSYEQDGGSSEGPIGNGNFSDSE